MVMMRVTVITVTERTHSWFYWTAAESHFDNTLDLDFSQWKNERQETLDSSRAKCKPCKIPLFISSSREGPEGPSSIDIEF